MISLQEFPKELLRSQFTPTMQVDLATHNLQVLESRRCKERRVQNEKKKNCGISNLCPRKSASHFSEDTVAIDCENTCVNFTCEVGKELLARKNKLASQQLLNPKSYQSDGWCFPLQDKSFPLYICRLNRTFNPTKKSRERCSSSSWAYSWVNSWVLPKWKLSSRGFSIGIIDLHQVLTMTHEFPREESSCTKKLANFFMRSSAFQEDLIS